MESLAKLTKKLLFIKEIMKKNPIGNNGKESNNVEWNNEKYSNRNSVRDEKLSQYS